MIQKAPVPCSCVLVRDVKPGFEQFSPSETRYRVLLVRVSEGGHDSSPGSPEFPRAYRPHRPRQTFFTGLLFNVHGTFANGANLHGATRTQGTPHPPTSFYGVRQSLEGVWGPQNICRHVWGLTKTLTNTYESLGWHGNWSVS